MRPILRPGTHVLRRGPDELQVGFAPEAALVVPDSPEVRRSLRLMAAAAELDAHPDASTVRLLAAFDQVVDERELVPLLSGSGPDRHRSAAVARATGPRAGAALASRARFRTRTVGFGPGGEALREQFLSLTASAGIAEASRRSTTAPGCGVLVGVGEPDRDLVEGWTRAGAPYLVVRLVEGSAVVGPFVVPGTTACLQCLDAHCTDADPAWPLLVRQYAEASAGEREDGVPEPVDPLIATLALAWAARDLASYVDGLAVSTWSATLQLDGQLRALETRRWLRHPACSCTWR